MTKQEKIIAGLIGVGAVLAIIYLWYESQAANTAPNPGVDPPPGVPIQGGAYPNSTPLNMGDINIVNGSNPDAVYNVPLNGLQIPNLQIGDDGNGSCECGDQYCEDAGVLVSRMTVPQKVLDQAIANLQRDRKSVV